MAKKAKDVMTPDPACCLPDTPLDEVARLMVEYNCGEIPVVDQSDHPVGVVTDRDIVCRVVAEGKNPSAQTAESIMSEPVVTVRSDASVDEILATMQEHQVRRVPVVDDDGCCSGIVAQADIATTGSSDRTGDLVRDLSRDEGAPSR